MTKVMLVFSVLLFSCVSTGCQYAEARWYDLTQVSRANVGLGIGASLHVSATDECHTGLSGYVCTSLGWSPLDAGILHKDHASYDLPGFRNCFQTEGNLNRGIGIPRRSWNTPYRPYEFGVDVFAGLVGAELAVDPVESLDFVLGLFALDIMADDGVEPLFKALRDKKWEVAKSWIASYPDLVHATLVVREELPTGRHPKAPPLHWAVDRGSRDMVIFLLDHGADMDARNLRGESALGWAARQADSEMVKLLIERGADVNTRTKSGFTPLGRVRKLSRDITDLKRKERKAQYDAVSKILESLGGVE